MAARTRVHGLMYEPQSLQRVNEPDYQQYRQVRSRGYFQCRQRIGTEDHEIGPFSCSNDPRSLFLPRNSAALLVAAVVTCSGVGPDCTISSASQCSKYPANRAGGPLSVPKLYRTPASTSHFKFC
jgi:hypothetical protein